jgi:hypothetical protein
MSDEKDDFELDFDFPYVPVEEYRKETVPRYRGNPYIEALPAMPSDHELAAALTFRPAFDSRERNAPKEVRIGMLDQLQTMFVALPRHVRGARALYKLMRTGYAGRKPFTKEDNERLKSLYKLQMTGSFRSMRSQQNLAAQHSMALIGASGCGKTYFLRSVGDLFPPVLRHPNGKWQLPILYVEMPYDGESVHTLAAALFKEMDRLLPHANYTELYMEKKRWNAEVRLAKAISLAYEHGAGLIVVDEQQNQRHVGNEWKKVARPKAGAHLPKNETPLAKLLITASNTSSIPLVLSGTLEMEKVLGARFTRSRRMSGRGSGVWQPLEASFSTEKGKARDFDLMMQGIWSYQWVRKPCELSEAWLMLFHDLTQGVPDIIIKLFESSQEAAIMSGKEALSPELVRAVFDREFMPASFGLSALREDDPTLQEVVTDLYHPRLSKKKGTPGGAAPAAAPAPAVPTSVNKLPKAQRQSPDALEMEVDSANGEKLRAAVLAGKNPVGVGRK